MISVKDELLWRRIKTFDLGVPGAEVTFAEKLARNNHWSSDFTERVITEYRRFLFLSCISPTGASPSKAVDEAWHLHLTYTVNYWKDLCNDTVGREIHHHPSKGGSQENKRHGDWYEQTLQLYKETFDESPPDDIWPSTVPVSGRQTTLPGMADIIDRFGYSKYLLLLFIPFGVPLLFGKINPYDLAGAQFLLFFACLSLAGISCLMIIWNFNKRFVQTIREKYFDESADAFQITRYVFGRKRSINTAIVDLVDRKILQPENYNNFLFLAGNYHYAAAEKNPLIRELIKTRNGNRAVTYNEITNMYDPETSYHPLLEESFKLFERKDYLKFSVAVFITIIGVARCIQGSANNRPIGYLVWMIILFLLISAILYYKSGYRNIFAGLMKSKYQKKELGQQFAQPSMVNEFAFIGIAALSTSYLYNNLENTFRRNNYDGHSYGPDTSSWGSSDGGGSDGGSSCGGGCGGCGGGGD